jgi:hypothetical protein
LALSLREQWPGMYKDFRHYCQTYNPKPGGAWSWKGPNSPVIINLFTQEPPASDQDRPGKATLPNVNHALQALKKELQEHQVKSRRCLVWQRESADWNGRKSIPCSSRP